VARDYYGEFFPWFYQNLRLHDLENNASSQIYAKNVQTGSQIFSENDLWLALVLSNPTSFYDVKTRACDIFIKDCHSRLLTRVTWGESAVSPNWLG
jgi:hypothetical protein